MKLEWKTGKVKVNKLLTDFQGMKLSKAIEKGIQKVLIPEIRKNLARPRSWFSPPNPINWTGAMSKSLDTHVISQGYNMEVDVGTFGINYGLNVEEGTPKVSAVDLNKLRAWYVDRKPPMSFYMLVRKIAQKGSNKYPFMVPALEAKSNETGDEITSNLKRTLRT